MKRMAGIILLLAFLVGGCSGESTEQAVTDDSMTGEKYGDVITLDVEGRSFEFRKAESWSFTKFGLAKDVYWLETAAHDPEMNTLVLYFSTNTSNPDELAGEQLTNPDYSVENPDKERRDADWVINRFVAGGKWYQGHIMSGTVTDISDGKATVEIDSTFLEFDYDEPEYDEEGNQLEMEPGREVRVTGTVTLPFVDESKE